MCTEPYCDSLPGATAHKAAAQGAEHVPHMIMMSVGFSPGLAGGSQLGLGVESGMHGPGGGVTFWW